MSDNDKLIYEKIENHRMYANQEADKIEREMRELAGEARDYADRVFQDTKAVAALFRISDRQLEPEHKLLERAEYLARRPQDYGRLKGLSFLPKSRAEMQPHLEKIVGCLRDHVELVPVRAGYHQHAQQAINAVRLPASQREEALRQLDLNRDYYDTKRDATHQRAMERRRY